MIKNAGIGENIFAYSDLGTALMGSNGAKGQTEFIRTDPEHVKIVTKSKDNPWTWKGRARQAGAIGMGIGGLGLGAAGGYYGGKLLTDDLLNMHESDSAGIRALRGLGLIGSSALGAGLGFIGGTAGAGYLMSGAKGKPFEDYKFLKDMGTRSRHKGIRDNDTALYNLGYDITLDHLPQAARNVIKPW